MSDVVAVAALGVVGTAVSGIVSWLATRRHAEVESAKVVAEHTRQLAQYREEERRKLQEVYLGLLAALNQLDWWARNPRGLGKHYQRILIEIANLGGGCEMFGNEQVRTAIKPLLEAVAAIEAEPVREEDGSQDRLRRGYRSRRDDIQEAKQRLVNAMRTDVALPMARVDRADDRIP